MTDLKSYFPSPEKKVSSSSSSSPANNNNNRRSRELLANTQSPQPRTPTTKATSANSSAAESSEQVVAAAAEAAASGGDTTPFVVKTARPNSKLILQNMEEVLNSVKKQHRQKHRRKREQRKLQQQLQQQQQQQQNGEDITTPMEQQPQQQSGEGTPTTALAKRRYKLKTPLQENGHNHVNVKRRNHRGGKLEEAAASSPQPSGGPACLMQLFTPPPKKHSDGEHGAKAKANVFEVMMNARNKSQGQQTPSKQSPPAVNEENYVFTELDGDPSKKQNENSSSGLAGKKKGRPSTSTKGSRGRGRPRTLRLGSVDQNDPEVENGSPAATVVAEDNQSPTKAAKRDSLLGYFAKRQATENGSGGEDPTPAPEKDPQESAAASVGAGAKRKLGVDSLSEAATEAKRLKRILSESSPAGCDESNTPSSGIAAKRLTDETKARGKATPKTPGGSVGRGRGRPARLPSMDTAKNEEGAEESVFTSPTKKRDSLLGYFSKKPGPEGTPSKGESDLVVDSPLEKKPGKTPRRRRGLAEASKTPFLDPGSCESPLSESRPRRSCAGKVRYSFADEMAELPPTGTPARRRGRPGAELRGDEVNGPESEGQSDFITILDDSNSCLSEEDGGGKGAPATPSSKVGSSKKLAPLFMPRSMPKPSPDPEQLKARHTFLMSGVPEKIRLERTKQKLYQQSYDATFEWFPRVAHVPQYTDECRRKLQQLLTLQQKLRRPEGGEDEEATPTTPVAESKRRSKGNFRLGGKSLCSPATWRSLHHHPAKAAGGLKAPPLTALPVIEHKRDIVKVWKSHFDCFPTYKCYNQLREKYHYFSAIDAALNTEQVSESFVVTRRSLTTASKAHSDEDGQQAKPPPSAPNGELLFTEKYKPLLFEQVLVNLTPVRQLRDFLANWSNGSGRPGSQQASQMDDSFTANDSSSSQSMHCNTMVLLGPVSSGKTNAVYAMANELNFNVLEINAGMKRKGKKLIQELHEATQSHQIRSKEAAAAGSVGAGAKLQQNLFKITMGMKKSKAKASAVADSPSAAGDGLDSPLASNSSRKCLILIEDADIVFDQCDAGFTDAIYTLAASSKRPVIVVASNPNAPHLQRLISQNTITFSTPHVLKISQYLAVLSLLENCPINLDDLVSLYLFNNTDLRKTLLEMQFFIQSGGDRRRQTDGDGKQQFFASPTKRCAAERQETRGNPPGGQVYLHNTLFELFTHDQNALYRIPYPVDFRILRPNLTEIFRQSPQLHSGETAPPPPPKPAKGRKSRSPKKAANAPLLPLSTLCQFYENLSVASMLDDCIRKARHCGAEEPLPFTDRLVAHIEEDISHTLVEEGVAVNLGVKECPHNLFESPYEEHSLCDYLGHTTSTVTRTKRSRCLDYEPCLRSICRSEKSRSTLERRSTRFYHYLRGSMVNPCNFSTDYFDSACNILHDSETPPEGDEDQQQQQLSGEQVIGPQYDTLNGNVAHYNSGEASS